MDNVYDMSNDWNIASSEPGSLDNNSYRLKNHYYFILFIHSSGFYTLAPTQTYKADIIFNFFF